MEAVVAQPAGAITPASKQLVEKLTGSRILITGGTGFVGTAILATLDAAATSSSRIDVAIASRARPAEAANEVFRRLRPSWIPLDVSQGFEVPGSFDFVIHAASSSLAPPRGASPLASIDTIVGGTRNLIDWASHQVNPVRILHTSSGAVYGLQPPDMPAIPEGWAGEPVFASDTGGYAEAKRMAEYMLLLATRAGMIDAVNARLFAFVGPSLPRDAHFAVGNFLRDALAGGPVVIAGTGAPVRSYLYQEDMALWILKAMLAGESGRAYNVGSAEGRTLLDVATIVASAAGVGLECRGDPSADGARERYVPDVQRTTRELGVLEWTSLEDAIAMTLRRLSTAGD